MPLIVRATPDKGAGVFTTQPFPKGTEILRFGGCLLCSDEIPKPLNHENDHYLQVGVDRFLGPSGGIDDLVNHSCDPNCKVDIDGEDVRLISVREIPRGTEVTFDYSTTSTDDLARWSLQCTCRSARCRGIVSGFHTLPTPVQQDYICREMVPMFVLDHFVPFWLGLN